MKLKQDHIIIIVVVGAVLIAVLLRSQLQGVVGIDCPEFKSNYEDYGTYSNTNIWVAADCNGDGDYEAYGYNTGGAGGLGFVTGITPEGYSYYCSNPGSVVAQVWVYYNLPNKQFYIYKVNTGAASNADTTCEADVGPECGDGTCDTGETAANCPVDCGGSTEGCYVCASLNDNLISEDELVNIAVLWING